VKHRYKIIYMTRPVTEVVESQWAMVSELEREPADARVIEAGSSSLLKWCATQTIPCLALYGRPAGLPMANTGPDKVPAYPRRHTSAP
jgi:hypothetical protein